MMGNNNLEGFIHSTAIFREGGGGGCIPCERLGDAHWKFELNR